MGIVKKQGGIASLIIYLGIALGYINAAVLLPKYLTPEEIGLRSILVDFSTVINVFALMGISGVLQKFFPKFKDNDKAHATFFTYCLITPLIVFFLFALLIYSLKPFIISYYENSTLFIDYFHFTYFLTFAFVLNSILESYCRTFFKIIVSNFLKEVVLRITFTGVIILYILKIISLSQFFLFFTLNYFLISTLLLIYIYRQGKLKLNFNLKLIPRSIRKEIFRFIGFTFPTGLTGAIVMKIDTLMIGSIKNLDMVGIYSIALFIATLVEIPRRAVKQITQPLVSKAWEENDHKSIESLYKNLSISMFASGAFVFSGIAINIDQVYQLIPKGEIYQAGTFAVFFIGGTRLVDMIFGLNSDFLMFSSKYKQMFLFVLIFAITVITTNYYFIPLYGISGAAFASLVSTLLFCLMKFFYIKKHFNLTPFSYQTIKLILWVGLTFVLFYNWELSLNSPILSILLKSAIYTVIFGSGLYYLQVSKDYNELLLKLLKKLSK